MTQGKVEICGVNTAKLPILSEKEKEALFARIKEGDEEAKDAYIKGNLRLVLSVIRRFSASSEIRMIYFRSAVSVLLKQSIILIQNWT